MCELYFIGCLELVVLKSTYSVHSAVLFLHSHQPIALHLFTTQILEHAITTQAYLWHQLFQVHYYAMRFFPL